MRPLFIDKETKGRITEVVKFAQGNLYRPGLSETMPGDDARHIVYIFRGYRAVFSFTEGPDGLYRHLTVSVDGSGYPNPIAAFTLASEFGFTGWKMEHGGTMPGDWMGGRDEEEHCITLLQIILPQTE
jgi:hypothetical protein